MLQFEDAILTANFLEWWEPRLELCGLVLRLWFLWRSPYERLGSHQVTFFVVFCDQVAHYSKYKHCGRHWGKQVEKSHSTGINDTVIGARDVWADCCEAAKAGAQGQKELVSCSAPHFQRIQGWYLRRKSTMYMGIQRGERQAKMEMEDEKRVKEGARRVSIRLSTLLFG